MQAPESTLTGLESRAAGRTAVLLEVAVLEADGRISFFLVRADEEEGAPETGVQT